MYRFLFNYLVYYCSQTNQLYPSTSLDRCFEHIFMDSPASEDNRHIIWLLFIIIYKPSIGNNIHKFILIR